MMILFSEKNLITKTDWVFTVDKTTEGIQLECILCDMKIHRTYGYHQPWECTEKCNEINYRIHSSHYHFCVQTKAIGRMRCLNYTHQICILQSCIYRCCFRFLPFEKCLLNLRQLNHSGIFIISSPCPTILHNHYRQFHLLFYIISLEKKREV